MASGFEASQEGSQRLMSVPGLHKAILLHDGADLEVRLQGYSADGPYTVRVQWLRTTDMRTIRDFLERLEVSCEIIDNS